MNGWASQVVGTTESFLTWRKRRQLKKKEKQKKRHPIIEWVDAFLWAAFVVLLINQYLFQAYRIPTGSMEHTLNISDRIFVNKLIYGPELIPGKFKINAFAEPNRAGVVIFESPTYISKGPLFDIVQRVVYMLTLSLVDIDRNEAGEPRAHFLIKRAVGMGEDRLRIRRGEVELKPSGAAAWRHEEDLEFHDRVDYTTQRLIKPDHYSTIEAAVRSSTFRDNGLQPSESDVEAARGVERLRGDEYQQLAVFNETMHKIYPHRSRYRSSYAKYTLGWFIPDGWIFPMGDNRDNSNDARYFGPVQLEHVLGKAMFIYWPLDRFGGIE